MSDLKPRVQFSASQFAPLSPSEDMAPIAPAQEFPASAFVAQEQTQPEPAILNDHAVKPLSIWAKVLLISTLAYATIEWGLWWWQSFAEHWLLGSLVSVISLSALGWLGQCYWRFRRNRQHVAKVHQLRERWRACQVRADSDLLVRDIDMLLHQTSQSSAQTAPSHLDGTEHLLWLEQTRLQPLARQVDTMANEAALQTGVAVALSPFALADMLIVAWRSQQLIAQIAKIYGAEPDAWLRLNLLKRFIGNAVLSGSADMMSDLATDFLSAELAGRLSAKAGQGVLAAALMLKLAHACQREFSPAPNAELQKATTGVLLTELAARLSKTAK